MARSISFLWLLVVTSVVLGFASAVYAADDKPNPAGTWKWSVTRNNQTFESTLTLKLDGDKLTGGLTGRDGKETAIEEASFKDGEVAFQVTRERNGEKRTVKYKGKVSGDTITGKITFGEDRTVDWKADRSK